MGKLSMDLYLDNVIKKYKKANRREKGALLEEVCAISGYHKKHAIRLLNQRKRHKKETKLKRGRKERYSMALYLGPLKRIWLATEAGVKVQRGLSGTKPGTILKKHIPIKTDQWNEEKPGFLEADTVAHCGSSLAGDFAWSLTMTDICTGWTENRAVWNKGARPRYIQLTRSRPYHSDDNAHVEQKNWTHVRQLFGYERFGKKEVVELMNDLYKNEISLMNNYFLPNTKLIEKQRVDAKIIKKYDQPCTPYQRLMKSKYISEAKKEELQKIYITLNPFELRTSIKKKVDCIFRIINNKYDKNMCYK